MHRLLRETAHRPWPLPRREWIWRQSWLDLAFIHYRVDSGQLRPRLPKGLSLQEFDGSAWIALVPFRMEGVMRRPFPDFPPLSSFRELNVRTYVEAGGMPGVWFLSLDADSWPAVLGGRGLYGVPYFHARITQEARNGWFEYSCVRRGEVSRALSACRRGVPSQARLIRALGRGTLLPLFQPRARRDRPA
jgi:hypothetical protein